MTAGRARSESGTTTTTPQTAGGTTPFTWPGGFGAWGLMWVSYTSGGNIRVRVNGTDYTDESIVSNQGPTWSDAIIYMGTMGGGAFVTTFRLVELMAFPGQARLAQPSPTASRATSRRDTPSLGL